MVEVLFTAAIIAVLLSLLLPAMRQTIASARSLKCQAAQRSVAFDFQIFADDRLHGSRQNDDEEIPGFFRAETFQNSQYGLDRFWAYGTQNVVALPDASGRDPMRCPEVRGEISIRRATPCTAGAFSPADRLSFTFNYRLHRPATGGLPIRLNGRILDQVSVPLLWDVDAVEAKRRGAIAVFSAPAMGATSGALAGNALWFPGLRHAGTANFAFIDGHVESSAMPLDEAGWAWSYQPR
ncbi:MAG: hypothetical protein KF745_11035 [Phycisphaeraceae bacterium]|nr:hypothetical protein [Phycisphaeraceae bacterium]